MYLGSFIIDDTCTFYANAHTPSTGAAVDADAAPGYRVYEDETGTPILTGSMALLDDANTVGFYSEQITLSAANGFEAGKSYCIRITEVVGGVTGTTLRSLQIGARVDMRMLAGGVQSATDLKDFADDGYDPATNKVEGVKLADTVTTLTNLPAITANWLTASGLATDAVNEITDSVWTEDVTAYGGASAGAYLVAIQSSLDTMVNRLGGFAGTGVNTVLGFFRALMRKDLTAPSDVGGAYDPATDANEALRDNTGTAGAGLTASDDATLSAIAALNNLSSAQVNAEVVDALATDTYAEPTGAPSATAALSAKINYLYMALRNKLTITGAAKTFCDDSGAAEWSKTLADDGTTYTESEGV